MPKSKDLLDLHVWSTGTAFANEVSGLIHVPVKDVHGCLLFKRRTKTVQHHPLKFNLCDDFDAKQSNVKDNLHPFD